MTGCSNFNMNNIAPGYVQAYEAIKNAIQGYENDFITQDLIDDIPYASSIVRIGSGPFGLMILESIRDNEATWITADKIYFVIKNGKIIETKGLSNNLSNLLLPTLIEEKNLNNIDVKNTFVYYYSYDEPELYNLEVKANYVNKGYRTLKILEKEMNLTLVQENLASDVIGWYVTNSYWIDKNGYVWKSQQYISPKLPSISYEITKKPSY